jgi:hypothetical protein
LIGLVAEQGDGQVVEVRGDAADVDVHNSEAVSSIDDQCIEGVEGVVVEICAYRMLGNASSREVPQLHRVQIGEVVDSGLPSALHLANGGIICNTE